MQPPSVRAGKNLPSGINAGQAALCRQLVELGRDWIALIQERLVRLTQEN